MKIKTYDLTDRALDWAVADASGTPIYRSGKTLSRMDMDGGVYWQPSIDWSQGGPIIERERITVIAMPNGSWATSTPLHTFHQPTPLVAAMRCYVASKLGFDVDVPDELIKGE